MAFVLPAGMISIDVSKGRLSGGHWEEPETVIVTNSNIDDMPIGTNMSSKKNVLYKNK